MLLQNCPNPFNTMTEISFAIVTDGPVILRVYNILGAGISTLVNARMRAGMHTVYWDARDLASGVYFCRLQAGEFSKSIKMVLLK
jgi:hypothetical protein